AASIACAQELKPKLGQHAVTIQQSHDYLRGHEAPDYWALSPYYLPQVTDSACSLAAIAMLVNALRGLPPRATEPLVTQQALLAAVGNGAWARETAERGSGVTWRSFEHYVRLALEAYRLDADIDVLRPDDGSAESLDRVRRLLIDNERSDRDIVLAY